MTEVWDSILGFTEKLVVPDWDALVDLIPIGLAALVGLYLSYTIYRLATAAPTRRAIRRAGPVPPPGVHAPGPSFAPILGAFGAFMLMVGVIVGGIWLAVGVLVLAVTLLYWGREGLRDYDRIPDVAAAAASGAAAALPLPGDRRPPPGVHIPAPSFRPILVAIALTILLGGIVIGGWAIFAGVLAVAWTGLGWLRDARREYVAVVEADRTGHLDPGPDPTWPTATFAVLAIVIAVALLLTSGILPNGGGGTEVGSPAPGGGTAGGGPGESAAPSLPAADVTIAAENIAFSTDTLTVPAGRPFTIAFDNRDTVQHNVEIKDASGGSLFRGEIVTGPRVIVYEVPALEPGQYPFICSVHPNMTGTITAQ